MKLQYKAYDLFIEPHFSGKGAYWGTIFTHSDTSETPRPHDCLGQTCAYTEQEALDNLKRWIDLKEINP